MLTKLAISHKQQYLNRGIQGIKKDTYQQMYCNGVSALSLSLNTQSLIPQ